MKKGFSVKLRILSFTVIPAITITIAMLITGIKFMRTGMEEEVLTGLMSSAYTYKDIGENVTYREAGDSEIESLLKSETGYDFTWFDGDTRKNSSLGASVIGTKAADTVIKAVINGGNTFSSTNTQVAGKAYFVAYVPVKDASGNVVSMAFTGVSRESVEGKITKSILFMVLVAFIVLLFSIVAAIYLSGGMAGAISQINTSIEHLSNGEFVKAEKYLDRSDELGVCLNNTNSLIDTLDEIVSDIRKSANSVSSSSTSLSDMADQISHTAEDVSNAVQEIASGATQQADEIQNAATNVGRIGDAVGNVQNSTNELDGLAGKMKEASEVSGKSLESLKNSSNEMTAKIDEISTTIQRTQDAVNNISSKVEGITSIATQTNLLSLNASIEAARAGEAGKGFAVVAGEIGKLAEDSRLMADEIKKEMEILLEEANAAVSAADDVRQGNIDQQEALEGTIVSINGMLDDINSTVGGVKTISEGAEQCENSKNAVVDTMSALSAISQENAASSEETGASMQELSATVTTLAENASDLRDIAEKLTEDLAFFK
jgi:methyl-accepting chemotaxis protein